MIIINAFTNSFIAVTMSLSLLLADAAAESVPKQLLPRSIGFLVLRTPEKEFSKITGVVPEYCHHCMDTEKIAEISIEKNLGIFPPHLYKKKHEHEKWIKCDFYKGVVYRIEYQPDKTKRTEVVQELKNIYGKIWKTDDWPNGLSWIYWRDKDTVFSITFVRKQGDSFPLTLPVDTVISTTLYDRQLME
ncbi:MAG: hypothetical protein LJE56_10050, partial [Acidiferrobacterales bacterium]|nr:hypothetical protein [Acidiferrobacterales bacterium]